MIINNNHLNNPGMDLCVKLHIFAKLTIIQINHPCQTKFVASISCGWQN
jgi:hypothetical protein